VFFFSSRRRHTRSKRDWSSDVCSSDLLRGPNEIGVRLGPYDHSRPVVIDPVLSYSTFLGGVGGSTAFAVFADAQGNAYVAGSAQIGRASCRERVDISEGVVARRGCRID